MAIPDMNIGMNVVSRAASARWATHACDVALLNDRIVNNELLTEARLRPLWNLYPVFSLNNPEGRQKFLEEYHDRPVEKVRDYRESIAVMLGFPALLSVATVVVLRRQDTL